MQHGKSFKIKNIWTINIEKYIFTTQLNIKSASLMITSYKREEVINK